MSKYSYRDINESRCYRQLMTYKKELIYLLEGRVELFFNQCKIYIYTNMIFIYLINELAVII